MVKKTIKTVDRETWELKFALTNSSKTLKGMFGNVGSSGNAEAKGKTAKEAIIQIKRLQGFKQPSSSQSMCKNHARYANNL